MSLRKLYGLVQAVACLALPGVASAANFTFIAVLNSGQEIQDTKPTSNALGTALLTPGYENKVALLFD